MGVVVTPVTSKVGIDPAIKVPRRFGIDDQAFVSSAQEVSANPLDGFRMASFWVLGEPSTLMHADGDVRSGQFFKEI